MRSFLLSTTAVLVLGCSGSAKTPPASTEDDAGGTSSEADSGSPPLDSGSVTPLVDSGADDAAPPCTNDPACTTAGSQCDGDNVMTCTMDPQGCLALTTTSCPSDQTCATSGIVAACVCNTPVGCNQTGTFCEGSNTLVTCAVDANGCLATTETTCGPNQTCQAAAGCVCNVSTCAGVGVSCASTTSIFTCTLDANGCLVGVTTSCPATETCSGSAPSAKCG